MGLSFESVCVRVCLVAFRIALRSCFLDELVSYVMLEEKGETVSLDSRSWSIPAAVAKASCLTADAGDVKLYGSAIQ